MWREGGRELMWKRIIPVEEKASPSYNPSRDFNISSFYKHTVQRNAVELCGGRAAVHSGVRRSASTGSKQRPA